MMSDNERKLLFLLAETVKRLPSTLVDRKQIDQAVQSIELDLLAESFTEE